jgi:hypothetical protein
MDEAGHTRGPPRCLSPRDCRFRSQFEQVCPPVMLVGVRTDRGVVHRCTHALRHGGALYTLCLSA